MKVPLLQVGTEFPQQANSLPIQFDHWIFGVNESEYGNTVEIQNFQKSSGSGVLH